MQFLVLSRRKIEQFSPQDFSAYAEREAEQARTFYAENFLRQIWYRDEPSGGACLLLEAQTESEVLAKLQNLPLVQAGMLELTTIAPLKPYGGFGPRH